MSLVKRNPEFFKNRELVVIMSETTPADPEHTHYEWGASNSKCWTNCAGCVNFCATKKAAGRIPEDEESDYAKLGTAAHDWADRYFKDEITREEIPPEVYEHLCGYLDLIEEINETNGGEVFHEQQIPYFYEPSETGTLDHAVVSPELVEITDLKWGEGVYVEAEENTQAAIYAISLMNREKEFYNFTDETVVTMRIYQPRHRDFDDAPQVWSISYRELLDMAIDLEELYQKSLNADVTDLRPGKHCYDGFCPARKGACTVRVAELFEDFPDHLNPLTDSEIDTSELMKMELTDEARLRIFEKHKAITKFFAESMEETTLLVKQGNKIPGFKLVKGKQGNRQWGSNEQDAEKLLVKLPVALRFKPRRVLSPAQAETVMKKEGTPLDKQSTRFQNRWEKLVYRKPGKPKLALESDPEPAIATAAESFDDESAPEITADDCI